jgi:hypothetical protein
LNSKFGIHGLFLPCFMIADSVRKDLNRNYHRRPEQQLIQIKKPVAGDRYRWLLAGRVEFESVKKMNSSKYLLPALAFFLAACDDDSGPGLEIHDTKYTAIDAHGEALATLPAPCVFDQYTGLTWEVKTAEPGLRAWHNTYSWYDPGETHDGELDYRGTPGAGQCQNSDCDTHAYVEAVNSTGHCGFTDWRVPLRGELASISDPRGAESLPTVNPRYFPHMQSAEYWSANDFAFQWNAAWVWNFQHGHDRVEWKATPRHVRLVRGEAMHLARVKD